MSLSSERLKLLAARINALESNYSSEAPSDPASSEKPFGFGGTPIFANRPASSSRSTGLTSPVAKPKNAPLWAPKNTQKMDELPVTPVVGLAAGKAAAPPPRRASSIAAGEGPSFAPAPQDGKPATAYPSVSSGDSYASTEQPSRAHAPGNRSPSRESQCPSPNANVAKPYQHAGGPGPGGYRPPHPRMPSALQSPSQPAAAPQSPAANPVHPGPTIPQQQQQQQQQQFEALAAQVAAQRQHIAQLEATLLRFTSAPAPPCACAEAVAALAGRAAAVEQRLGAADRDAAALRARLHGSEQAVRGLLEPFERSLMIVSRKVDAFPAAVARSDHESDGATSSLDAAALDALRKRVAALESGLGAVCRQQTRDRAAQGSKVGHQLG
ncbi:hypothetical protein DIPPA_00516 [Diplonema papillatum]|nr:hypothetical protein DIPPA_00516 [Diplonema papillatum]